MKERGRKQLIAGVHHSLYCCIRETRGPRCDTATREIAGTEGAIDAPVSLPQSRLDVANFAAAAVDRSSALARSASPPNWQSDRVPQCPFAEPEITRWTFQLSTCALVRIKIVIIIKSWAFIWNGSWGFLGYFLVCGRKLIKFIKISYINIIRFLLD